MAQVLEKQYDDKIKQNNIYFALNSKVRIEILKALSWDNLSYAQIQNIAIGLSRRTDYHTKNIAAHHVRILKKFNLISKSNGRIYYLTMRGTRVLAGLKLIEESEMFI